MNRLTVALFATQDADYDAVYKPYLKGANDMLKPFAMEIEVYPSNGSSDPPRILPYSGPVFDAAGDPGTVRAQAHQALPVGRGIPVIFCKRQTDTATTDADYGSTIPPEATEANGGIGWPCYILINTQIKSVANEVLLHEMIHAAWLCKRKYHDKDKASVFYEYGTEKNGKGGAAVRKLPPEHADALRKAYFSVYVP
jgi:hypothetical protein